jgi:hypothetical protein
VGLRAINLKSFETAVQQDIFGESQQTLENEKVEDSIYKVRQKYGKSAIKRGRIV